MATYKNIFSFLVVLIVVFTSTSFGQVEVIEDEYLIVMSAEDRVPANLDEIVSAAEGKLINTIPQVGIAVAASESKDFAKSLEKNKMISNVLPRLNVQWIPSEEVHLCSIGDNETLFWFQWALHVIDAPEAWDAGETGAGVRVAVLDTGIDYSHPDLADNFGGGWDFVNDDPNPMDDEGHGTHVAGIIAAADNEFGVIGVAPDATVIAVKVLDADGSGYFDWILQGIVYAVVEADADVINMSLSGAFPKSEAKTDKYIPFYVSIFNRAVNFATKQGAVVVSAAGNDAWDLDHNQDWIVLPAEAGNGIAVSATGPVNQANFDNPASYTNFGTSVIDVAAPGGDYQLYPEPDWYFDMVLSTYPGGWAWAAGTSMAAPHVAGVAALVIGANGGGIHPAQVKAIIEQSAEGLGKPGSDDYYGRGRINAYLAVTR